MDYDEEQQICVLSQLKNLAEIAAFISDRAALAGMDEEEVLCSADGC